MPLAALVGGAASIGGLFLQKRWADTAHQREVRDLRRAGLNPIFSAGGRGAESPDASRAGSDAVASALAVRRAKAEIGLIEAQARQVDDQALLTRAQVGDIQMRWRAGHFERLVSERDLAALSVEEKRQMVPIAIERAKAEVQALVSSARATAASALLDELAATGALNEQRFEELIGRGGPATRFLLQLIRGVNLRRTVINPTTVIRNPPPFVRR